MFLTFLQEKPSGAWDHKGPLTIHGLPMVLAGMASSQCHSHLPPLSFVQLSACQQHQEGRQAGHYRVTGGHTEAH